MGGKDKSRDQQVASGKRRAGCTKSAFRAYLFIGYGGAPKVESDAMKEAFPPACRHVSSSLQLNCLVSFLPLFFGEQMLNSALIVVQKIARDREVLRQLAQTQYSLGKFSDARANSEALLAIDPNDAGAYMLLAPIYASEGRASDAERANALYLQFRDDPLSEVVAARFFAAHPEWNDERIGIHIHGESTAHRPILTGMRAAPIDKP